MVQIFRVTQVGSWHTEKDKYEAQVYIVLLMLTWALVYYPTLCICGFDYKHGGSRGLISFFY